jgi:sec-independent protein translocase protein TatC
MESIQTKINISLILTLICCIPILIYSIYKFCKPAINDKHIWATRVYLYSIIILIVLGFLLGITIFSNYIINSLSYYQIAMPMWSIKSVIGLILTIGFAMALILQTILFVPFIINLGLVTRQTLIKMSLGVFLIISILAALITPPDLISQLVLSVPFYVSFWCGITISKLEDIKHDWSKRINNSWNNIITYFNFRS